jgi:ABC-type multidrug transport system ATPase subunit
MVGLNDLADQKIATLSGGQRRRLDVAIGIVGRPVLLFLDEPTAGFDPHARREFHDIVHRLSDLSAAGGRGWSAVRFRSTMSIIHDSCIHESNG